MVLVTGAMASVIFKLGKLLNDEYKLQTGVRKKIQTLTRDLESMHAALHKVAEVPPNQLDEEVKLWARDVGELSYNVEDILDTFLVRVDARDEEPHPNKIKHVAKKIGKLFSKSKAHHKIAGMIKSINEQAEQVAERHRRYRADDIMAKPAPTSTVDPRLAAMFRVVSQLIGLDKSKEELMSMLSLCGEGSHGLSNEKMKTVSVVGAGGLGKTTLAKAVYDTIRPQFDCGAFVPVGQNPDLKKVLRDILIDLDKNVYINSSIEKLDERQLLNELQGFLQNKRYFVVIDDIWEPQTWETIQLALVDDNCGCRVLITTRKFEVAKEAGEVYKLQPLSDDNSKRLFYTRLFGCEDKCPNNHLGEFSDRILKKCCGVPLAIITMASFLLGKSRSEWIEVCTSPGFCQHKNDRHLDNTMQILSFSFYDLPPHLKTCLLYLSVFPEDSLIDKGSLIWKWIAEGFVEKKPRRGLFEVGEEYFYDLINRSLIQGVDSRDGIINSCRVHDMVLDLIVSISSVKNFVNVDGTLAQSHTRRLALKNKELDLSRDTDVNIPQVRSLLVLKCGIGNWALHPRLKLIRVLDLEHCSLREGSQGLMDIANLLHLRHLRIRGIHKQLPEGIGKLKFLQTLELEYTAIPLELPCSIGMLTQLVCLRAQYIMAPPDGVIGRLTSLEELQIGGPSGKDQSWRQFMKDLGNLCELKVLNIDRCDTDDNMQNDFLQSLDKLQKMQHLRLGNLINTGNVNMNAWDAAVPSLDLRCLFLPAVYFTKLPSWINYAHLPSLSHLQIRVDDLDEQGLIALGRLPELCYLSLEIDSITSNNNNTKAEGCFQKLRSLVLTHSMIQFVANEDSSASFTICSMWSTSMVMGCRRMKNDCRVVPSIAVMPNLEQLEFSVYVQKLMQNNISCEDIGLEYLPSLRRVKVDLCCFNAYEDEVEREEAVLRHTIEVHPNHPALQIKYNGKDRIKRRSDMYDAVQRRNEEETRVVGGGFALACHLFRLS